MHSGVHSLSLKWFGKVEPVPHRGPNNQAPQAAGPAGLHQCCVSGSIVPSVTIDGFSINKAQFNALSIHPSHNQWEILTLGSFRMVNPEPRWWSHRMGMVIPYSACMLFIIPFYGFEPIKFTAGAAVSLPLVTPGPNIAFCGTPGSRSPGRNLDPRGCAWWSRTNMVKQQAVSIICQYHVPCEQGPCAFWACFWCPQRARLLRPMGQEALLHRSRSNDFEVNGFPFTPSSCKRFLRFLTQICFSSFGTLTRKSWPIHESWPKAFGYSQRFLCHAWSFPVHQIAQLAFGRCSRRLSV